jgi:hypothetical protein
MMTLGCATDRRTFLKLGAAGLTSLSLPGLLRAREAAPKDTRVVVLWLAGGPSHLDLWDMKPDAPAEYRGYWRPIRTNVDGMRVSELLPRQARQADKFSILRSLHHGDGDHPGSEHLLLTGRDGAGVASPSPKAPSIGSIAARFAGPRAKGVMPYVVVPSAGPGYHGAHYAGAAHDPFETGGDPNRAGFSVRNLRPPGGLSLERLDDRRALRRSLDTLRRDADRSGRFEAMDRFEQQAFELVTSPAVARAFELDGEDPRLRDAYGRNSWGQGVLLARRLAEAGVTFTTVNLGGWDQHDNLKPKMEEYLPKLDAAVASLFEDLAARGLLEKTLVVVTGEMSRTPKMNAGGSRDHWSDAISLLIGGGGVKGGRVVGKTDARGEQVVERPVSVPELHATIHRVLGIDPAATLEDNAGRPVAVSDSDAPIRELL